MWTMKMFFVLFGACVAGSWAHLNTSQEPPPCGPTECLLTKCANVSKSDCEDTQMGLFVAKGDRCGCCDVCVPFLRENEVCDPSKSHLLLSHRGHDTRAGCMPGLECNGDTARCETPRNKGQHWTDKAVEESCERSMTGEGSRTYTSTVHGPGEPGTSCGPGLVYRGDVEACERPRDKREIRGRAHRAGITESDPESANLKGNVKSRLAARRRPPARTFRIRWSACEEPNCDRGVCPPKMSRKTMCDGRFYPDRRCKCCGECNKMFLPDDLSLDIHRDAMGELPPSRIPHDWETLANDFLTCQKKGIHCFQYVSCESHQMHKKDSATCKGHFETDDPVYCGCCGKCLPFLKESMECAVIDEGNPVYKIPSCEEGMSCERSPIDGRYVCQKPCPDNCAEKACKGKEEVNILDCPKSKGHFSGTNELCACCGLCKERLRIGEACLDGNKALIEPGCAMFLICKNGVCTQDRNKTAQYIGPGKTKQEELLQPDPTAWTRVDFPQIDREGFFYPVQCEAYKCYCVAPDGSKLGYVMPRFFAFNMVCDCAREKYYGKSTLKCDHMGNYQDLDYANIPRPPAPLTDNP